MIDKILDVLVDKKQQARKAYAEVDLPQHDLRRKVIDYSSRIEAAQIEGALITIIRSVWPEGTPEYALVEKNYDPPTFSRLRATLKEVVR